MRGKPHTSIYEKDLIEKQEKENNFDANIKGECI